MDLHEVAPDLDKWIDDHCIITKADRVEATLDGEAMYAEVVGRKMLELVQERNAAYSLINELRKLIASTDPECASKEALILIGQHKRDQAI